MKWLWVKKVASSFLVILFCFSLFIYTIAFPGNTSWFILLFFCLLSFLLFLSSLFSWGKTSAKIQVQLDQTNNVHVHLATRGRLPIFIPELIIQLKIKDHLFETELPVLFKNDITASFTDLEIPRGHYHTLFVKTLGKDFLGLFWHAAGKKIALEFDVYPKQIPARYRQSYLQKLLQNTHLKQYLKSAPAQFHQIREYQPQDSLKQIDWKSSYRQEKLMTKEYEKETQQTITMIFYGADSPFFEEMLSLFYTLYLELKLNSMIRLNIIGTIDKKQLNQKDESGFLLVEPAKQSDELLVLFQSLANSPDYLIVFAPKETVSYLKNIRKEQLIYFTETDLVHSEVSGNL